jgi:predicted aldo/keto reductase-like oxidoreductase
MLAPMNMPYRPFGRTGEKVSILGFGAMRLPFLDGHRERIDVPLATKMLHYALDNGVNYVDTAFPYHGASFDATPGNSEGFVGDVLAAGGYRDKVLVATKLPHWLVNSREDMDRILNGQLQRLRTDRIDCYLMHGMGGEPWEKLKKFGVLDFLEEAKADGRIRHAGFSYHDDPQFFAPVVDGYDWDFCQIQYNYLDTEYQAGAAGLAYAAGKGLAVIVMEPLKGGRLAAPVPAPIQAIWDGYPTKRSPQEWALRFVWDDPRVSMLLSGMSTFEQVVDNVELAAGGEAGTLTPDDHALIATVRDAYRARIAVDCTGCRYCMPCPQGIDIPLILGKVNDASLYEELTEEKRGYHMEISLKHTVSASECTECGQCEGACPQQLEVIKELANAVSLFE